MPARRQPVTKCPCPRKAPPGFAGVGLPGQRARVFRAKARRPRTDPCPLRGHPQQGLGLFSSTWGSWHILSPPSLSKRLYEHEQGSSLDPRCPRHPGPRSPWSSRPAARLSLWTGLLDTWRIWKTSASAGRDTGEGRGAGGLKAKRRTVHDSINTREHLGATSCLRDPGAHP